MSSYFILNICGMIPHFGKPFDIWIFCREIDGLFYVSIIQTTTATAIVTATAHTAATAAVEGDGDMKEEPSLEVTEVEQRFKPGRDIVYTITLPIPFVCPICFPPTLNHVHCEYSFF